MYKDTRKFTEDIKLKPYVITFIFMILLWIPTVLLNGWILMTIWNLWTPLLFDFQITLVQSVAISTIIDWLLIGKANNTNKNNESSDVANIWINYFATIITKLILLGVSTLVYQILVG